MVVKSILWTIPFFSFLAGYYLINLLYTIPELQTPCVVGKQLPEAVKILSNHNLNARLLAEKEDADLPDYTIVSQTPREEAKIKAHQSVFLVLTRQPEKPQAPHLLGKTSDQIEAALHKKHIRHKCYSITSNHPKGHCFAQYPRPEERLDDNSLICYMSNGSEKPIIVPDLRGKPLTEVQEFLATHDITPEITGSSRKDICSVIVEQRPLPGSIVPHNQCGGLNIQLQIK